MIDKAERNEAKIVKENTTIKKDRDNKTVSEFELGFNDEHLIFSKPVKIEVNIADQIRSVSIQSKHFGDAKFSGTGLGLNENTCGDSGESLIVPVIDKKVVFYTCGASTFTLNNVTEPRIFDTPNPTIFSTSSTQT
jgi:hypothetical protein